MTKPMQLSTNDYYAYGGPWGDTSTGQGKGLTSTTDARCSAALHNRRRSWTACLTSISKRFTIKKNKIIKMKKYLLFCVLSLNCTLGFIACNHDDDQFQESIQSRILGRWRLTGYLGKVVYVDSTYYVFTPDGWILLDSKPNSQDVGILTQTDTTHVSYEFVNNWAVYNETTNEFEGEIRLHLYNEQGEEIYEATYNCIIGNNDMSFIYNVTPYGVIGPIRYVFKR